MSIIQLAGNLDEMQEFEPLPAGPYPAQLQDLEIRHSEKVPQGYFYMQFRISPDHFPADYDVGNAPEGLNVIYARVALPDPANRRTVRPFKKLVEALGIKVKGTEIDPEKWIGKECQLLLSRQDYQGAPTNNVDAVAPLPRV